MSVPGTDIHAHEHWAIRADGHILGTVKRYLTTRPSRATLVLIVLGIAMLVGSAFAPGEPVTHMIVNGRDVPESRPINNIESEFMVYAASEKI